MAKPTTHTTSIPGKQVDNESVLTVQRPLGVAKVFGKQPYSEVRYHLLFLHFFHR